MTGQPDRDELLAVLDHTDEALVLVGRDGRVRVANRAAIRWLDDEDPVGRPLAELLPEPDGELALAWRRATATGQLQRAQAYCPASSSWLDLEARPVADGVALWVRDITEERREQLVGIVMAETAAAATAGAGTVRALTAAAAALRRITGYEFAAVWLRDLVGTVRLIDCDHAASPELEAVAETLRQTRFAGDRPARCSLDESELRYTPDLTAELDPALAEPVTAAGLRTGLHLPLHWPDGSAAVISLLTRATPGDDDWHAVLTRAHSRLAALAVRVRDHQELAQLFDLARSGLCISGADGRFHRVNPQLAAMLGRGDEELTGRPYLEVVHPDDRRALSDAAGRLLVGGEPEPFEHRVVLPSGEERILSWVSRASPSEGLLFSTARDVTEERRRERFETDQRRVLEGIALDEPLASSLQQVVAAATARLSSVHNGAVWLTDGENDDSLRPTDEVTRVRRSAQDAAQEAMTTSQPAVVDRPGTDAVTYWAVPVRGQDQEPVGALVLEARHTAAPSADDLAILEDTARLASVAVAHNWAQLALLRSEKHSRMLADAVTDALWTWDIVDDVVWFNEAFVDHFGHRLEVGHSGMDLWTRNIHEQDRDRVLASVRMAVASDHDGWEAEYRCHHRDGSESLVLDRATIMRDDRGRALRMVGGVWDLTARREREAKRERARRLASLGTLAGGLAHDLGNMLAPILLSAEMLAGRDLDETSTRLVTRIEHSARRGGAMVEQVMAFARGTSGEWEPVDLSELITGLAEEAAGLVDEEVTVVVDDADELPPVLGDASQLHQVLLNLVVNARDAMPGGGTLTLTARRVAVGNGDEQVRLCVDDTGTGMTDEVCERVFEPFFTTKAAGKGTGLGMAVTIAIIEGHGGTIDVVSHPGRGTQMIVDLPAACAAPTRAAAPSQT